MDTSLEKGILAPPSLKNGDCNHVVVVHVQTDRLMGQMRHPELDSHYSIELADGLVLLEDGGRESGVVCIITR